MDLATSPLQRTRLGQRDMFFPLGRVGRLRWEDQQGFLLGNFLSFEIHNSVISNDVHLYFRVLFTKDNQVIRFLFASTGYK